MQLRAYRLFGYILSGVIFFLYNKFYPIVKVCFKERESPSDTPFYQSKLTFVIHRNVITGYISLQLFYSCLCKKNIDSLCGSKMQ